MISELKISEFVISEIAKFNSFGYNSLAALYATHNDVIIWEVSAC